jgi:hypothetical protein
MEEVYCQSQWSYKEPKPQLLSELGTQLQEYNHSGNHLHRCRTEPALSVQDRWEMKPETQGEEINELTLTKTDMHQ